MTFSQFLKQMPNSTALMLRRCHTCTAAVQWALIAETIRNVFGVGSNSHRKGQIEAHCGVESVRICFSSFHALDSGDFPPTVSHHSSNADTLRTWQSDRLHAITLKPGNRKYYTFAIKKVLGFQSVLSNSIR